MEPSKMYSKLFELLKKDPNLSKNVRGIKKSFKEYLKIQQY